MIGFGKKILKILLSLLYLIGLTFEIYILCKGFAEESLLCISLSVFSFCVYLFICISPRTLFNRCWKLSKYSTDNFDYDTSYSKLENVGIGILITSIIFLGIGILLTI